MEPTPPPIPPQPKRSWWSRNWKWFVPTGCLTVALLFVALIMSIILIVFGAIKSTDVYKDAIARAKANPAVIEALGSPIKEGLFVSGNTNVNGASGEANLSIPISGPNGKGTIYVKAAKSLGRWNYSDLVVEIQQTGTRIDLIKSEESSEQ
jgi:cytochrome oxidase complex assembly protein 1